MGWNKSPGRNEEWFHWRLSWVSGQGLQGYKMEVINIGDRFFRLINHSNYRARDSVIGTILFFAFFSGQSFRIQNPTGEPFCGERFFARLLERAEPLPPPGCLESALSPSSLCGLMKVSNGDKAADRTKGWHMAHCLGASSLEGGFHNQHPPVIFPAGFGFKLAR